MNSKEKEINACSWMCVSVCEMECMYVFISPEERQKQKEKCKEDAKKMQVGGDCEIN